MLPVGTTVPLDAALGRRSAGELEDVYREHSAAVSRWVRRLWGPRRSSSGVDEEDLLHEIFLVVQRRLPEFRGEAVLTTWLYSITVWVVNARRKKERWRRLLWRRAEPELAPELGDPASAEHGRAETSRIVYSVLDSLRERDRTLLILFELEQLPGAEIAAILHMSEANLWVALSRARARFKQAFERQYGDLAEEGAFHGDL
jgi:RNA polymerase sigma-70 factor (ECF subfamily)